MKLKRFVAFIIQEVHSIYYINVNCQASKNLKLVELEICPHPGSNQVNRKHYRQDVNQVYIQGIHEMHLERKLSLKLIQQ